MCCLVPWTILIMGNNSYYNMTCTGPRARLSAAYAIHMHTPSECACALRILSQRMLVHTVFISLQAEVTSFTFAEACAQPSAKHVEFHGSDGPVHVVEVNGTFFIQNNEAEAKAARSKAAANPAAAAAAAGVAANPAAMPEPAAAHRISYAAVASKSPVGPKPSAAGFEPRPVAAPNKISAGLKRSTPASQPAVVPAPLEVSICMMLGMHVNTCRCSATCTSRLLTFVSRPSNTTPNQVVDDFAVAQSTPLPECITGVEGDKVRAPRPPQPSSLIP